MDAHDRCLETHSIDAKRISPGVGTAEAGGTATDVSGHRLLTAETLFVRRRVDPTVPACAVGGSRAEIVLKYVAVQYVCHGIRLP
jgi:hypothetical protein